MIITFHDKFWPLIGIQQKNPQKFFKQNFLINQKTKQHTKIQSAHFDQLVSTLIQIKKKIVIKKVNKEQKKIKMNSDGLQELGLSQVQIKKQVAYIMSCFQDTIVGYNNNRRQLQLVLNQLLKAYKSYKSQRTGSKLSSFLINNTKDDIYFQFYLLNNIACLYYTKKQSPKALDYLKKAQKQLVKIQEIIQKSEYDYQTRKLQLIVIHMRMAKIKLNLCGIYAMLQRHPQALLQCTQALGILDVVVESVCDYSMGEKYHQDFLQLQKCIKQPSSEIKQVQIRNTYWNQVMNGQSDDEIRNIFLSLFKNSNSKQQVQVRSCLGKIITKNVQKIQVISQESRKYLKQFNISSIMKITPLALQDFSHTRHKDQFISLRFLHQLMLYTAIANYTISTEIRIGSMYHHQYDGEATIQSLSALTSQEEANIFRKNNNLFTAQRHHFFAIQLMYRIASNYMKECPFFSKLIKIYEEIYLRKDNIQIIPQKADQQNQISIMPTSDPKYFPEDQYFGKKFKQSICQTPRVLKKILGTQQASQKDLVKMKRKEKQQAQSKRKKTVKKGSSITKNQYLCMSPRQNSTTRLTSEQKKIRPKNKSIEKILPVTNTLRKSKGEGPKSPRRVFNYS